MTRYMTPPCRTCPCLVALATCSHLLPSFQIMQVRASGTKIKTVLVEED